jgi:hypothetical protein
MVSHVSLARGFDADQGVPVAARDEHRIDFPREQWRKS